jgi:hypothetical protein
MEKKETAEHMMMEIYGTGNSFIRPNCELASRMVANDRFKRFMSAG